jgi:hypothetical protein
MESLSNFVYILFFISALYTMLWLFFLIKKSSNKLVSSKVYFVSITAFIWLLLQGLLSFNSVYATHLDFFPPKMVLLGLGPFFIFIAFLFILKKGREWVDSLPLTYLYLVHAVRIPIEFCLYFLFLGKTIPEIMTFEGRNWDILAGVSSLLVYILIRKAKQLPKKLLITWNLIGIALLFNIILISLFSFPSPIQKFGLTQPNIAMLHFPFSWLPTFIVPLVLFAHLASLRLLLKRQN